MKLITLVIFLAVSATSYGLSCVTTEDPLVESLNDFNYDALMDQLKKLPTNEYEDGDICRVELIINYAEQLFAVKFTEHIENENLNDKMIQFDTLVEQNSTNIGDFGIINFLEYACSEDGCEKKFISDHITWLRTFEFIELKRKIESLLIGNGNKTGKCFVDFAVTLCPSKQCLAFFTQEEEDEDEEIVWEQACVKTHKDRVFFQITHTFHLSDFYLFELRMQCEFDKCNSIDILDKAKLIVDEEYNTSPLLQALDYESGESDKTSPVRPLISSSTQAQQSSSSSTTSSYKNNSMTTIRGTTTPKSTGPHIQSTNAMIYLALLILTAHLIVHPFV